MRNPIDDEAKCVSASDEGTTLESLVETATAVESAVPVVALPEPEACRLLREQAGLSLADASALCGVDKSTVARWEAGQATPRRHTGLRYRRFVAWLADLPVNREVAV